MEQPSPTTPSDESASQVSQASQLPAWREFVFAIVRTIAAVAFIFWLLTLTPTRTDPEVSIPLILLVLGMIAYTFVLRLQLNRVHRAKLPGLIASESLIISAALFIAIFSALYVIVDGDVPGSFSEPMDHFAAAYFTLTVLATVGFGDITPVSDIARFLVMVQMALGLGFLAVMIKVFTSAARRARLIREQQSALGDREQGQ